MQTNSDKARADLAMAVKSIDQSPRRCEPIARRPLLITALRLFLPFWAAVAIIVTVAPLLGSADSVFTINGRQVTREYWNSHVLPLEIAVAAFAAPLAYGFLKDRAWSRHLAIAAMALVILLGHVLLWSEFANAGVWVISICIMLSHLALMAWYFYDKQNVADYYRSLKQIQGKGPD